MTDTRGGAVTPATLGAWLIKASPTTYPIAGWIREQPDEPITAWSVQQNYRSAMMDAGQPIYLWVSGNGRDIEPGVWGYGQTSGPCEVGAADGQWLAPEAAARATYFAMVEIDFLASPVKRSVLRSDPRFADLEVLRMPAGSNPSFLTNDQAAAMRGLAQAADRGACPRCNNEEILHIVFGLLPPGALDDSPPWVTDGGCVIFGHPTNRHCPACELDWLVSRGGRVQVRTLNELRVLLGRETNADVEEWLSDHCDVDVYLEDVPEDHDDGAVLSVRIATSGVGLEFPFSLPELLSTVDELLDDVTQEWEHDS